MDKFIRDRLSTIVSLILGTGYGWGFAAILAAPELKTWLITISVAVSFLLSLIISLTLIDKTSKAKRQKIIRRAGILFSAFALAIILFFIFSGKYTIAIPMLNKNRGIDTTVIVKGLFYTPRAKAYRDTSKAQSQFKEYPSDDVLLDDAGYDIKTVWSDDARTYARLLLLVLYTLMISLFIAGVTLTTEVIVRAQKDASK